MVMRAWLLDSYDGVDSLRLAEVDEPRPAAGEALLDLKFAALNPADAFLAVNQYPAKPKFPHILGRDGVGTVVAVGEGVTSVKPGGTAAILRCDAGVNVWGTLAQRVTVPAASLVPLPAGWTLEQMAGAPLVFITAWQALTQWGGLPPQGQVLLVTGASGGVGVASVMLGKSMGLTVVALSRSAEKGAKLREFGADFVFDPASPTLRKDILAALSPRRVDLVVDSVAGPLFETVVAVLGYGGRISVVGRSAGVVPQFNTATLFFRRNRIGGVSAGDYTPEGAQAAWAEVEATLQVLRPVVRRLTHAIQRPVVDSIHEFEDVKAAFARLARGPLGKVLVHIGA